MKNFNQLIEETLEEKGGAYDEKAPKQTGRPKTYEKFKKDFAKESCGCGPDEMDEEQCKECKVAYESYCKEYKK
jgi:hypothetical protein